MSLLLGILGCVIGLKVKHKWCRCPWGLRLLAAVVSGSWSESSYLQPRSAETPARAGFDMSRTRHASQVQRARDEAVGACGVARVVP